MKKWNELKVNNRNKAMVGFSGLNKHAPRAAKKYKVHWPPTQLDSFFGQKNNTKPGGNDQQLATAPVCARNSILFERLSRHFFEFAQITSSTQTDRKINNYKIACPFVVIIMGKNNKFPECVSRKSLHERLGNNKN